MIFIAGVAEILHADGIRIKRYSMRLEQPR